MGIVQCTMDMDIQFTFITDNNSDVSIHLVEQVPDKDHLQPGQQTRARPEVITIRRTIKFFYYFEMYFGFLGDLLLGKISR